MENDSINPEPDEFLPLKVYGKITIVSVYVALMQKDNKKAIEYIKKVPERYFTDYMYVQAIEDKYFGELIAYIIEVLGYGFWAMFNEQDDSPNN